MKGMYAAIAVLIAFAAVAGLWQVLYAGAASDGPLVAKAPAPPVQAPRPAAVAPVPDEEPVAGAVPLPADIPAKYRGKIIRARVRHFPDKLLALTFDDGPTPDHTPAILKALREHDARATFFVLGRNARKWPELVQQAAAEGHAIGSHSYSHPEGVSAAEACSQLSRTADLIEQATGQKPRLFRPPYGITKGTLCQTALQQGYTGVLWTISSADSRPIGADVIARNIIHTPNPGDIVLMHDGGGHAATAAAVPRILAELGAAGFRFVTIPELLAAWEAWQMKQGADADAQA